MYYGMPEGEALPATEMGQSNYSKDNGNHRNHFTGCVQKSYFQSDYAGMKLLFTFDGQWRFA
jgi:hypothetical protein